MSLSAPHSFLDARQAVFRELGGRPPATELITLDDAAGRVLAQPVLADRDQPPFDRSTRDGFAVRVADVADAAPHAAAHLRVVGQVPAGQRFAAVVGAGEAVEIMTGAPVPAGADAVLMVEHAASDGALLSVRRPVVPGENIVCRGSELRAGQPALPSGVRLDPAAIGLLAALGCARPTVYRRPRVAILTTGDELVDVDAIPTAVQIRDANRHLLAAQVRRAGGVPVAGAILRDRREDLRRAIEEAVAAADLIVISGGVSMGKYDLVEEVLAGLGARVVFDGVEIRPGKPLVFGRVGEKPFFGLPGNPISTLVTCELFVRPALAVLEGTDAPAFRPASLPLGAAFTPPRLPLTVFLPGRIDGEGAGAVVHPVQSQGSGDLAAMARADCLIMLAPGTGPLPAGTFLSILPK